MKKTKSSYYGMDATTTSWDWGFKPVPCKGGNTTNYEDKEQKNKD